MEKRIEKIQTLLTDSNLDAILISSLSNITYLTNYFGFVPEDRDAYVFVTKTDAFILTNPLYAEAMPREVPHLKVIEVNRMKPLGEMDKIIKKNKIKSIGFEDTNLTVAEFEELKKFNVKFVPFDLTKIRIEKSAEETKKLQTACKIGDMAFTFLLSRSKPGITENELGKKMEIFFMENNCGSAFRPVIAFGKNASVPHHLSGETKLGKNDLILADFGVKYEGYCSDMTRTFFMGKATKKQKEVYEIVRDSQHAAIEFIVNKNKKKETIISSEVDQRARQLIIEKNYPSIPHSLGHGIGLDVHEYPRLSPQNTSKIMNNLAFTIEPGIYLPGEFGVRIEDMFMIVNNKLVQFTHAQSELIEL